MKHTLIPCVLALAAGMAFAQANTEDHSAHHPEGVASAPAPSSATPTAPRQAPDAFDKQMKMMDDMHARMQSAKTPAEKQALMAEHLKVMQSGMRMMSEMGKGRASTNAMGAPPEAGRPDGRPGSPSMGGMNGMGGGGMMGMHGSMERRMAMMERMMRMMVDREEAMPRR